MGHKITDKLDQVAPDDCVREALRQIFLFEVDQGPGGVQYKKYYREFLERCCEEQQRDG